MATLRNSLLNRVVMRPAGCGDGDDVGLAGAEGRLPIGAHERDVQLFGHVPYNVVCAPDHADNFGARRAKRRCMAHAGESGSLNQHL